METYSSEFLLQIEILILFLFFFQKRAVIGKTLSLKGRMQKTELKNLHFSMRYLQKTKRQNSHRITWRGGKVKPHWQRFLIPVVYVFWRQLNLFFFSLNLWLMFKCFTICNASLHICMIFFAFLTHFFNC